MAYELRNARALATEYIMRVVGEGDTAIDATMGNGHDTLCLASLVGTSGHVFAFDVQQQAIDSTRKLLEEERMLPRVTLLHTGHENIAHYVSFPVTAVMFNLGWLPGGDKQITTRTHTTLCALEGSLSLIKPGGVVTVCVYPGHEEGDIERMAVEELLSSLDVRRFTVLHHRFINTKEGTPELFLVQKQPRKEQAVLHVAEFTACRQ